MYLNWRTIEGYNVPLQIVIGERGMGKTFYPVFKHIKEFLRTEKRFIYLVDTDDAVKMISSNHGEKFFARILEYMINNPTKSNQYYHKLMTQSEITTDDIANKIIGGTIIINNKTAGYILSIDNFHKTKRNNFTNISAIIVDEFIPEKTDIRTLQNPYKLNNIIQSISRTDNVKIYMLGNSVNVDDPIVVRFGLHTLKTGEIRRINVTNEYGTFNLGVAWKPNPKDYPKLQKAKNTSIAGLFSQAIGETNLETNTYKNDLPNSLKLPPKLESSKHILTIHGNQCSIRFHWTKSKKLYCLHDYGQNVINRICIDKKYIAPNISFVPRWKETILKHYNQNNIYFDNGYTYNLFKLIFNIT